MQDLFARPYYRSVHIMRKDETVVVRKIVVVLLA